MRQLVTYVAVTRCVLRAARASSTRARGPASARAGARACAALNITAIYMYLYLDSGMMLQDKLESGGRADYTQVQ